MDYCLKNFPIDLKRTLFSGQAFRWGEKDGKYFGIVGARSVTVGETDDGVTLFGIAESDIPFWRGYFDADTDYTDAFFRFEKDATLKKACEYAGGLRLLRQEKFETLISFIISQNNNIPRITGIIGRLCEAFGEEIEGGFAFPTAKTLAALTVDQLSPLRAGFRARYILDAAQKVESGALMLEELGELPYEDAKARLKTIIGVGEKVADCVLLFAYGFSEAFPKDVWIKRAMARYYPEGLPDCVKGYEGLAQQFLFEYIRNNKEEN